MWCRIFLVCFGCWAQVIWANTLSYTIRPVSNEGLYEVLMQIETAGKTIGLKAPSTYTSPNRPAGTSDNMRIELLSEGALSTSPGKVQIIRTDDAPIEISYIFRMDPRVQAPHYPVITKDYFQFPAEYMLIVPEERIESIWDISVNLDLPNAWRSATERKTRTNETLASFLGNAYAGGNIKIECHEAYRGLCISYYDSYLSAKTTAPFSQGIFKLIENHHMFWSERLRVPYWSFIRFTDTDRLVGTHTGKTMLMFLPSITDERLALIYYGFSHELFHQWLGRKILPFKDLDSVEDRFIFKAIVEGFTDYYGLRIAKESGLVSEEAYAQLVEGHLRQYNRHPARGLSLTQMASRNDYERYLTPAIHLMILKHLRLNLTTAKIDLFIRTLPAGPITRTALFKHMETHLGERFVKDFDDNFIQGGQLFSNTYKFKL